jgi:hypothetical protein
LDGRGVADAGPMRKATVGEIIIDAPHYNRIALTTMVDGPIIQSVPVIEGQRVSGKKQKQSHNHKRNRNLQIPDICYDLFLSDEPD